MVQSLKIPRRNWITITNLKVKANMMVVNVRSMKSAVADIEPKEVEMVKTFSTLVDMYQLKQLLRSTFPEMLLHQTRFKGSCCALNTDNPRCFVLL